MSAVYARFVTVAAPMMCEMRFHVPRANSTVATIRAHFRPLRFARAINSQAPISISPEMTETAIRKLCVACS